MGSRADSYGYDRGDTARFERFTLEPIAPDRIETRLQAGAVLETTDIPTYLDRGLVVESDTGAALYRLVQLFGTPNVPGVEAGADQRERTVTTWQYLFRLHDAPADGPERDVLCSIYDYKTDVSVGLSGWRSNERVDDGAGSESGSEDEADDESETGKESGDASEKGSVGGPNVEGPAVETPTGAIGRSITMPDEELLVLIVQLACNVVEEPVPATHEGLWV